MNILRPASPGAEASGRADLMRLCYALPAVDLQPPARRPKPPVEPFLDRRQEAGRLAAAGLRGQLARHLPELGGAGLFAIPSIIEGMIATFLNATTADGYNPYRITRDGIDWEVPEPRQPVGQHRLLGRPPDHLPAKAARDLRASSIPACCRRCLHRPHLQLCQCALPDQALRRAAGGPVQHDRLRLGCWNSEIEARVDGTRHGRQAGLRRRTGRCSTPTWPRSC
ncbi:MAG: hypothetical protein M0C28_34505 [Candidatus Moduliflexus flocculans]|nr:hypothetical protein [Candidatus Moduliflexus flocculans]